MENGFQIPPPSLGCEDALRGPKAKILMEYQIDFSFRVSFDYSVHYC